MWKVVAHCKYKRILAGKEIHQWRQRISATQPTLNFFFTSTASFSSPSSRICAPLHNYYIRKRRKWPIQPSNKDLPQFLAFQLAKKSFKQSIKKSKSHLLPALINAFAAYEIQPSPQSYHFLFKVLIQSRPSNCHDQISQVLDHIEKVENFDTPECIFVDLIKFYGGMNMFDDAVELFSRIPRFRCEPSLVILNALLSVLSKNEKGLEIIPKVLFKTQAMNIRIEESTFETLIRALCKIGSASNALELLDQMVEEGFDLDRKVCSLILATICRRLSCRSGEILGFFGHLKSLGFEPRRDDFFNVIRFLVYKGGSLGALKLLKEMKKNGVLACIMCYNLVMNALICDKEFRLADKVFDELLVLGLVPDIYTYNAYINGLCMQRKVDEALAMMHSMEELGCEPDSNTFAILPRALCEAGEVDRARDMMYEMRLKRTQLDQHVYAIVINGFVCRGDIDGACSLICQMLEENLFLHSKTYDRVICWLCKTGLQSKAEELLEKR